MKRSILCIFCLIFLFAGCSNNITNSDDKVGVSQVSFYFSKPNNISGLIESAVCTVTASDMETMTENLIVTDSSVFGTIEDVPAGYKRKFEISTYDSNNKLTYNGYSIADVPTGQVIILNITLYPVDGTGSVIINGTFSDFPQSDEIIVFESGNNSIYDIYKMDPIEKTYLNLTNTPDISENRPRISPGKSKILFFRKVNNLNRPYVMDIDGSNITELNITPGSSTVPCDWSPDGKKIIVVSDQKLYIVNLQTNELNYLYSVEETILDPRWTPDGEWIIFAHGSYGTYQIYLIKPDGSDLHALPNTQNMECRRFSISPDSQTLAICARYATGATWDLFSININGSSLINLTNTPTVNESKSTWSPDGQKILFARFDSGDPNDLYCINAAGSNYAPFLLMDGEQNYPHWK